MSEPQARTVEDLREDFMDNCRGLVRYWAAAGRDVATTEERLSGLLHSLLTAIDGCDAGFPYAIDLVCRPHPDDKAFNQSEGEDWVEDGTVLNADVMLHEFLYRRTA